MADLNGRYLVDAEGKRTSVVIEMTEYQKILEDLEELASIRAYDAAKKSGDEAIPFDQAVREIEASRQ